MTIDALTVAAERSEAATMLAFESWATPETVSRLGIAATEIAGSVVLAVREDPSQYWSKVFCLGLDAPITAEVVGEVVDFYRDNGNKLAVLQITPSALPEDWADICARHGLTGGRFWHKLVRGADADAEPSPAQTSLRIAPVPVEDGDQWARVMMRGFGMPEELAPMVSNVLAEPGVTAFGAYEDGALVGSGTLSVVDVTGGQRVGQFVAGMTLPEFQGRGAQSALIAARMRAALDAGCGMFVAETGDELPGEHNTSLHNLLRAGFRVMYKRQNWIWRA